MDNFIPRLLTLCTHNPLISCLLPFAHITAIVVFAIAFGKIHNLQYAIELSMLLLNSRPINNTVSCFCLFPCFIYAGVAIAQYLKREQVDASDITLIDLLKNLDHILQIMIHWIICMTQFAVFSMIAGELWVSV